MCGDTWCEVGLAVCSVRTGMSGSTGQRTDSHAVHRHSSMEEVQPLLTGSSNLQMLAAAR